MGSAFANNAFANGNIPQLDFDDVTNNGASTANNGNVSWTPTTPGTYYYICDYHPSMLGTITITE